MRRYETTSTLRSGSVTHDTMVADTLCHHTMETRLSLETTFMLSALIDPMNYQKSPALIQYQQEKHLRQLVTLSCLFLALVAILAARIAYLANN